MKKERRESIAKNTRNEVQNQQHHWIKKKKKEELLEIRRSRC